MVRSIVGPKLAIVTPGHPAGRRGAGRPEAGDGAGGGARRGRHRTWWSAGRSPRRPIRRQRRRRSSPRWPAAARGWHEARRWAIADRKVCRETAAWLISRLRSPAPAAGWARQYPGRRGDAGPRRPLGLRPRRARRPSARMRASWPGIEHLGVTIVDDVEAALAGADAIIDFTAPAASVALAKQAAARGLVHIIGTTGCSVEDDEAIRAAAAAGARIVKAGNFSLGRQPAARARPAGRRGAAGLRHRNPRDAPQQEGRRPLGHRPDAGRGGGARARRRPRRRIRCGSATAIPAPREQGTIGFATLRGGNVIGEHTGDPRRAGRADRTQPHRRQPGAVRRRRGARRALGGSSSSRASIPWPTCSAFPT